MRREFIEALGDVASRDERVVLLTGDLGFSVVERFADRFPKRFFNVGVAEQNMAGLATGLAEAGYIPFLYSIATFASMRPYEFIRNGALLHELPVRIIGVGGGFEYGHNGLTHYALEDVALMRAQPDLTVVMPVDASHARAALAATVHLPNPVYYRIAKSDAAISGFDSSFELGRAGQIGAGSDVVFVTMGPLARDAATAVEVLAEEGIEGSVLIVPTLNPSPVEDVADAVARTALTVTAEAHYVNGGLGSFVAEVIAEGGYESRLIRCGVREIPRGVTGSQEYLQERFGLSARRLAQSAAEALDRHRR